MKIEVTFNEAKMLGDLFNSLGVDFEKGKSLDPGIKIEKHLIHRTATIDISEKLTLNIAAILKKRYSQQVSNISSSDKFKLASELVETYEMAQKLAHGVTIKHHVTHVH